MVRRNDDDHDLDQEEETQEKCPNCGSPIAWEDVCTECGHDLDDSEDEDELDDDLDVDVDEDYDLDEIERDGYELDDMDDVDGGDSDDDDGDEDDEY